MSWYSKIDRHFGQSIKGWRKKKSRTSSWILQRSTDGQRQQVAESREKERNKAVKLSLCGRKVGTKGQKESCSVYRGVISAKRSPNALFVTQQTGTHREDSRVRLVFHLFRSLSLLHFVKKISEHSSAQKINYLSWSGVVQGEHRCIKEMSLWAWIIMSFSVHLITNKYLLQLFSASFFVLFKEMANCNIDQRQNSIWWGEF